jgi:hypothetical protein
MKIIFLDIDGVLVTTSNFNDRIDKSMVANPLCIDALNYIIDKTDAKIVISSAWKYCGQQEMSLILKYWGVNGEVIGLVPNVDIGFFREEEIKSCIQSLENVESIVIIDDMKLNFPMWLVKTDFESGLTKKLAEKAIAILEENNE